MFYTVDMDIEIDVQDAFDMLDSDEKKDFINENIDCASDESLVTEIQERGLKIAIDMNNRELVSVAFDKFLAGGMTARDFLADCLGMQHSASVDEIINKLKLILQ